MHGERGPRSAGCRASGGKGWSPTPSPSRALWVPGARPRLVWLQAAAGSSRTPGGDADSAQFGNSPGQAPSPTHRRRGERTPLLLPYWEVGGKAWKDSGRETLESEAENPQRERKPREDSATG